MTPPAATVTRNAAAADRLPQPRSLWIDSVCLGGAVFLLACCLRQRKFHGLDAQYYIGLVRDHSSEFYVHRLYVPLMHLWHGTLAPLGASPFQSLALACALGVGVGALCLHRAALRLGFDRVAALLLAALAVLAPAVVFFGTVVEIHGVFFGFAALAVWQWTRALATGSWPGFALLGIATAFAAAVHTTGHLLLWLFALSTWGFERHGMADRLADPRDPDGLRGDVRRLRPTAGCAHRQGARDLDVGGGLRADADVPLAHRAKVRARTHAAALRADPPGCRRLCRLPRHPPLT